MASKSLLFAAVLLIVVAAPTVQSQLLGLINIAGILKCSAGTTASSAAATSVIPNTLVQLQCGGNVIASATTNSAGMFRISVDLVTSLLSTLLSSCNLVANTPLASCDATLPTGGILHSALTLLGGNGLIGGLLGGIVSLVPVGFNLV